MTTNRAGGVLETVRTVVYAVLIALVVRTLAYEPFNIPSKSMVPTLLVGDYLFVSKFSYGYSRYSLPFSLPVIDGRLFGSAPERGDVAVFKLPRDNETDYIKRVIGLPGDSIQVTGGILHINGVPVQRQQIEDYIDEDTGQRFNQYIETLPNGVSHPIIEISDSDSYDNTGVFQVPPGHYFMMGDNRDNSLDSRATVGYVPAVNLIGRAEVLFFSIADGAAIWQLWRWPGDARFGRIFDAIS